jgi:hypothetical protein
MKSIRRYAVILGGLVFLAGAAGAQGVPPGWEKNPPRDMEAVKYSVGLSMPQATEQGAFAGAWQNALQNFAASIGTTVSSQTDITVTEQGFDGEIADAFTVTLESSSFSTQVQLTGVRELARKVERQGASYIVYMLASMNTEDWQRAARYIENEEAAFLAYRFFAQRLPGITLLAAAGKPAGFEDFYIWLRNSCVIISVSAGTGSGANAGGANAETSYLDGMVRFAKKLYRNSLAFSTGIEGLPSCVIYDSPRYRDGLLRAFAGTGAFTVTQPNAAIVLASKNAASLSALRP